MQPQSLDQLSNDLGQLLNPKTSCFSDIILKCGDLLIPAHKNILSTRSPVFAAMFANEMKEKYEKQVDIIDMEASVVEALIIYIYSGKTSNLTIPLASDLIFAADKYLLDDLKRVCCDFLKENISLQNVLTILALGNLHAEDLKCFAIDYICNNCSEFSVFESTAEWKTLRKEKPDLALDVMTSLVKSRDQKSKEKTPPNNVIKSYDNSSSKNPDFIQPCFQGRGEPISNNGDYYFRALNAMMREKQKRR